MGELFSSLVNVSKVDYYLHGKRLMCCFNAANLAKFLCFLTTLGRTHVESNGS